MTILKEFDLRISGDKAQKRKFSLQIRCITAFYERLFPKFKTPDCWKVLINCVQESPKSGYRNFLGVYEIDVAVDLDRFAKLSDDEKKEWAYESLYCGIQELLDQTKWDSELFMVTFDKLREQKLQNVWVWKSVRSPSRNHIAEVLIEHDVQNCVISLIVRDRKGKKLKQEVVITELPDEWAYAQHLGKLIWRSDTKVVLKSKDSRQMWSLEL